VKESFCINDILGRDESNYSMEKKGNNLFLQMIQNNIEPCTSFRLFIFLCVAFLAPMDWTLEMMRSNRREAE
jgi:hypothetical protein